MKQRLIWHLAVMAILLTGLLMSGRWYKDTLLLRDYASEISNFTEQQFADAVECAQSLSGLVADGSAPERSSVLKRWSEADFTCLVYRGDSLVAWSNNLAIPPSRPDPIPGGNFRLEALAGGWFAVRQIPGTADQWAYIPIRYDVPPGRDREVFPANPAIPGAVGLQVGDAGQEPVLAGGQVLGYLWADDTVQPMWVQAIRLVLWGAFWLVLAMFLFALADAIGSRKGGPVALGVVALPMLAVLLLCNTSGFWSAYFPSVAWLSVPFTPPFLGLGRVGDLVHLVLVVFLTAGYALANLPRQVFPADRGRLNAVAAAVLAAGLLFTALVWRQTAVDPNIDINLLSILRTNAAGITVLFCGLLLQVAAAMVASSIWPYAREGKSPFPWSAWLLGGLLLQAFLNGILLQTGSRMEEKEKQAFYAGALAEERDTLAESEMDAFQMALESDAELERLLKPWPFKPNRHEVEAHLRKQLYRHGYLFEHYALVSYAFDNQRQPLFLEQKESAQQVIAQCWDKSAPVPGWDALRSGPGPNLMFSYWLMLHPNRMGDATQKADLLMSLQRTYPVADRVYERLFFQTPFKGLRDLSTYNFAVYQQDQVQVEYGQIPVAVWQTDPASGAVLYAESSGFTVAKSRSGQTKSAVGRPTGGWINQVYGYALLFTLALFTVLILLLLNNLLPLSAPLLPVHHPSKGSLARRIHLGSVALVGMAFLVIGLMTYRHFANAAEVNARTALHARGDAVVSSLRKSMGETQAMRPDSLSLYGQVFSDMSEGLGVDAQVYGTDGILMLASRPALAQVGLLSGRMSPWAMDALLQGGSSASVRERLRGHSVDQQYLPLRNLRNELLGFVGIPGMTGKQEVRQEVSDFIGLMATLFVSLLLVAYFATFALSQSIVRPIQLISEKIQQFRLDDQNQPLEYTGGQQDELSDLIGEYNRMVDKLEASKRQMIRLEREGAWKEMARQVAHDIKNPLTTMKLSMQQLERVSSNPEQASAYLKKAITRLIEQIDSLAQIASEFSMFANQEMPNKAEILLNDVVEGIYDLFSEQKDKVLSLHVPYERYYIQGDKNQLIRVFNNLVVNATQAIPSDRVGKIELALYREGDDAVVRITDNGGGIPPEIRHRVFEPNFTTKTSGSGLGLVICRKIVEAHDGTIGFETRDNEGSDFFIAFPLLRAEPV
jgi:signal transduction histidine kinase